MKSLLSGLAGVACSMLVMAMGAAMVLVQHTAGGTVTLA